MYKQAAYEQAVAFRKRGFTYSEIAKICNVSKGTVSNWLRHETFSQDPTHVGPMWLEGTFNYFCGQWGGGEKGSFVNDAYGIDFAFKKLEAFQTDFILTVRLQKP